VFFGFALTALFVPGLTGAATAPRWALAAVLLPIFLKGAEFKFTMAHLFGLLFLAYAALSVSWSPNVWESFDVLIKLIVIAEAFALGSSLGSADRIVAGAVWGIGLSSLLILLDADVPRTSDWPAGLFVNSNALGEIAALVLVAAVARRIWWAIPLILPALIASHCRGAMLAVAGGAVIWMWGRSRIAAVAMAGAGVAVIVGLGAASSVQQRLDMWFSVLPGLSAFGHGLGSFYTLYPLYSPFDTLLQRPEHLHNDWLEFAFELGIVGAGLCAAFLWSARSVILAVLAIEACFGFPLHLAATAVLGGILSGHAALGRDGLRGHVVAWRGIFRHGHELAIPR
jgi:O-antigen ligase